MNLYIAPVQIAASAVSPEKQEMGQLITVIYHNILKPHLETPHLSKRAVEFVSDNKKIILSGKYLCPHIDIELRHLVPDQNIWEVFNFEAVSVLNQYSSDLYLKSKGYIKGNALYNESGAEQRGLHSLRGIAQAYGLTI